MKKTLLVGELLFYGKQAGVVANDLFNYAIGTIFAISPRSILFAEFYGNTSAVGGGETPEGDISTNPNLNTAELSGGGNAGAIGYGYYFKKKLLLSFGVSYDNNKAILFRPGIEWTFGGK
jgi:YadA-like membrane anchor domain